MNPKIDQYLIDGCMRCKYGGTPQCKVNNWKEELVLLRHIMLACGLTEDLKWGVPCYTSGNKNIALVSAFKDYSSLSFFKGVLLKDPKKILQQQGKSSQSARLIKFTNPEQIIQQQEVLKTYILEAIEIEKSGVKVEFKKNPEPTPEELFQKFDENPALKKAFYALTPGRQRGYIIHFSQPKKTETRFSRIEKCIPNILNGKGLNDR
ncbi:uncharacterized protein YdeI (YjbR/CyaY-like superfamily) [Catalinimonas alkaloidigena]|uniref:YdeI/OmpD-associated family protein n=1 Tax=Catalinimonas alkaloidigena TaxID=1075417 RepID=UPI002406DE17|nr:DUF1801 domain-containing protein [Catalinimonas alkaloidigena]MDF9796118.1 uncharacterized protein YdeI (YjbR/CyaY-like superfamily) [Catalinimonas alkaloidigena]